MADRFAAALVPERLGHALPVFDWPAMAKAAAPTSSWTFQEAVFAVLFSAAVCDGGFESVERDVLTALVHRSRALKSLSGDELEDLSASVSAKLHGREGEAVQEACQVLPAVLRLPIFAQALDVILADGDLTQRESAFLNRLSAHLHLAEQDVRRVADVIMLKNTV